MIARTAMGGVLEVTKAASRIAAGELDQPKNKGNRGEEIEIPASMFNTMQERISGLIGELKAVINNVAHDLRMPITRIRGVAETTLTKNPNRAGYQVMAVTVIEECERLVGQFNTILELAKIDAGAIVKKHCGTIIVHSNGKNGSYFVVRLPHSKSSLTGSFLWKHT